MKKFVITILVKKSASKNIKNFYTYSLFKIKKEFFCVYSIPFSKTYIFGINFVFEKGITLVLILLSKNKHS